MHHKSVRDSELEKQFDWITIFIYSILVILGWLNIYAADFDIYHYYEIYDISQSYGKQLIWIITSLIIILIIFNVDYRFYESFSYIIYGVSIFLLILVLIIGDEVAGSNSWIDFGFFKFQPSEFAKIGVALAISKFYNSLYFKYTNRKYTYLSSFFFILPILLILLQGDAGTAIVYLSFIIVLFLRGISNGIIFVSLGVILVFLLTLLIEKVLLIIIISVVLLIIGGITIRNIKMLTLYLVIAGSIMLVIFSVDFTLNNILKPHQRKRVMLLINPNSDPLGIGWNTTQSKIAIGSGGFLGKGYLEGTQTKYDFVPAQTTDFIFCTVGEEQGWLGSTILLILFGALFFRLTYIAERQKSDFVKYYAYCVLAIFFTHFTINICMTIGLLPVIGIPLPFFSYGGSSLWAFTILLFILLKLDYHRMDILSR